MEKHVKRAANFENYPWWMVLVSNLFSIVLYSCGAIIIYRIGLLWMILYLAFVSFLEVRLTAKHCVDCYYYGKVCSCGKGKISSIFFRKGNVKRFCSKQMTFKDLIPDFLVSFIPIVAGIVLIIIHFDLVLLILILLLLLLTFLGNALIRTRLMCRYCKQRLLGCPAEKMFDRNKTM